VPDRRSHRGAHPEDARDFAAELEPVLRRATEELSYLLTRSYAEPSALKLVGDRYQLTARQRSAVLRAACADQALAARSGHRLAPDALAGASLAVDGFNCLITVEAMLSGAPLFRGRDGALRDLASVHGSYRSVEETERAIELVLEHVAALGVGRLEVLLDRPVGNSGRLRARIEQACAARRLSAEVVLAERVDRDLVALGIPVATSDGWIRERTPWIDLPALIADARGLGTWRLTLGEADEKPAGKARG